MLKEKESIIRKIMIFLDGCILTIAFLLAYMLRQGYMFFKFNHFPYTNSIASPTSSVNDYLILLLVVVPIWCYILYLNGMYHSMRTKKFSEIMIIIIKSSFFALLIFSAFVFLFKLQFISRVFFATFIIISLPFIIFEKMIILSIMHYVRKHGHNFRNLVVVGKGKRANNFINKIKNHPEWGLRILGAIDDEPERNVGKLKNVKIIGVIKDLSEILHRYTVDEVVFVVPRARLNHIENAIYSCEIEGVKATIAGDLFDLKIAKSRPTELDGMPLLTFETTVITESYLLIKRLIDIVISGAAIIILSPIFLTAAILIKLTSWGPVLFKQERIGLNGRRFILYKFRTMYKGADKKLSKLKPLNEMDGPVFKIKKDPRITPLGRILRKFSIDEFPQLFNVFFGHMSLVGPRPPISEEVEQYKPWQRRRLSMRPGLTCLWQISGRNKLDFNEWMKLDLKYLDNWSLKLDFEIMMKTIPMVLFGIGAY